VRTADLQPSSGICTLDLASCQASSGVWWGGNVWERRSHTFLPYITLKHVCDLTDVLVTHRFVLLVKSLQWNRKIQFGNSWRLMLSLFELFVAVFPFISCGNDVPTLHFSALHPWASSNCTCTVVFVRYQQNCCQKVLNREALRLCRDLTKQSTDL